MKDEDFQIYCTQLILLNEQQLNALVDRINLLGGKGTATTEPDFSEDWLLPGIIEAMKARRVFSVLSKAALYRSKAFKVYRKSSKAIMKELERVMRIPLNSPLKASVAYAVGGALISWCKKRGMVGNSSSILMNAIHAIDALEEQFPGYMENNALYLVIRDIRHDQG